MIDGWNKGDWVVCVHHRFSNYTKGKKYQLVSDRNGSILEIVNDYDDIGYPSVYGFECGEHIVYFNTIENILKKVHIFVEKYKIQLTTNYSGRSY